MKAHTDGNPTSEEGRKMTQANRALDKQPRKAPLEGLKVIDMSRFIAGPLCTQMLGDMGATVIKIERPGGEDARHHAPFLGTESLYVMIYNRNKLGITLNTRHPRGVWLLKRLLRDADVLVENYRPGTLAAMGLPHQVLRAEFPRLVLTSISGFGQTGPYASRALFDAIAQAMSGLMSLTGEKDGEPTLVGSYIADYITGFHATIGTLLALVERQRSGTGQVVDVASLDCMFTCLGIPPIAFAMLGEESRRQGSRDLLTAPANLFRARDGYVYVHGGTDPVFARLCHAIGRAELVADHRFKNVRARMAHVAEIEAIVSRWVSEKTVQEVEESLGRDGVPCGPVLDMKRVVEHEQLKAREMLVDVKLPLNGEVVLPGIPIKLSETPGAVRLPPPGIGQHNEEVYCRMLGLDEADLKRLISEGVV